MNREAWRPVIGYERLYSVSDRGRVRSKRSGRIVGSKSGKYRMVWLIDGARRKHPKVRTVVAEAFHGPRPAGRVIRHLDGNELNNRADNLAYGTIAENRDDDLRHGVYRSKLDPPKVRDIRRRAATGARKSALAAEFGVCLTTIYNIVNRVSWAWL